MRRAAGDDKSRSKKTKVHPCPPPAISGAGDALVLLLPAALIALAAALPDADKEVLAYLIAPPDRRRCACFDCYTSFWTRWDSSPHRDLIHRVLDAFDEHLASSSPSSPRPPRARKRRERSAAPKPPADLAPVEGPPLPAAPADESGGAGPAAGDGGGDGDGSRKAWPDVMGMLNSRLWSLWSPA